MRHRPWEGALAFPVGGEIRRPGRPDEIAGLVAFLVSNRVASIHGSE